MEKYIPKSALLTEIEKIKSIEFYEGTPSDTYACMALDMVKETIDTLEVKEVDLDKEINETLDNLTDKDMQGWFRYFLNLVLKQAILSQQPTEVQQRKSSSA